MPRVEEGGVVRGWLGREERGGLAPGQVWYLVPMAWWTGWHNYVNWCHDSPVGTLTKKRASSALANDNCSKVVGTGYTPLADTDQGRPGTPGTRTQSRQSSASSSDSPVTPRKHNCITRPGMIDTTGLIVTNPHRGISVLTGEGGKLKNSGKLLRGRDYELVPERLWKFLVQLYGGSPALQIGRAHV